MSEPELQTPNEADLRTAQGDALLMHYELLELELYRLRREMFDDPRAVKLNIGLGQPVEQTIDGNQQDPYNGVLISNPTPATLSVGFQAGAGLLSPLTVQPWTWLATPARFVNLSIATLLPADQATAIGTPVTVQLLRVPPPPAAGQYEPNPLQPVLSLPAGSSAIGAGAVLDNLFPRSNHSIIVVPTGAPTAGTVRLQGSANGVDFVNLGSALSITSAAMAQTSVGTTPVRWTRANITGAIVGGTVAAYVASSG